MSFRATPTEGPGIPLGDYVPCTIPFPSLVLGSSISAPFPPSGKIWHIASDFNLKRHGDMTKDTGEHRGNVIW
ncbi:unnamed protein product [Lasius platythorax]|uniref:Uncharacterized protein n=1 Tax=Lasius platythorax TaxID=488582 RepID=A0AAV2PEQ3_9HYME